MLSRSTLTAAGLVTILAACTPLWSTIGPQSPTPSPTPSPQDLPAPSTSEPPPSIPAAASDSPATKPPSRDYRLVWSDEFNGTSLDTAKWGFWLLGPYRQGVNTRDAVSLDGKGHLVFTTSRRETKDPLGRLKVEYPSAMLSTQGKYETTHGYFEARLKFQSQQGFWSAFWINTPSMGNPAKDPGKAGVEIDIIEYIANAEYAGKAMHTIHWDAKDPVNKQRDFKMFPVEGIGQGWHTYGCEWTPDAITFFIDGKETMRSSKAVSQRPEYIVLGLEVGNWGGDISKATLPDTYQVDYVRVFQRPNGAAKLTFDDRPPSPDALKAYFSMSDEQQAQSAPPWPAGPLSKTSARTWQPAMWAAYKQADSPKHQAWKKVLGTNSVTAGGKTMSFSMRYMSKKPDSGWPLLVSLHGGGNVAKDVNDKQWANQQARYMFDGVYICPRAAIDGPDLWHASYNYPLMDDLIRAFILNFDVDPDRVYIQGYSEGGYGVNRLGPNMADRFGAIAVAAAGEMLNRAPVENLRNTPMNLQVGDKDDGFDRFGLATRWADEMKKLAESDECGPPCYGVKFAAHQGMGHAIDDKNSPQWLSQQRRDPVPRRVVWRQSGPVQYDRYWLHLDDPYEGKDSAQLSWENRPEYIDARYSGNLVTLQVTGLRTVTIRLDDRMMDLDKPVTVTINGREAFTGMAQRSAVVLAKTLAQRGDPKLMFCSELTLAVSPPPSNKPSAAVQNPGTMIEGVNVPPSLISKALELAGDNATQLRAALSRATGDDAKAVRWMIATMPERDLREAKAEAIMDNVRLAMVAWRESPWAGTISEQQFMQYILPATTLNERREPWRHEFMARFREKAWSYTDPVDAAKWLNDTLNATANVQYHATNRCKPDQSVNESMASGWASCSGLSVLLTDACRSVGIPARIVGVPMWKGTPGNHNWVEVWGGPVRPTGDQAVALRRWYNVGGTGSDPRAGDWVNGRCRDQTDPDIPQHSVYATCWRPVDAWFPMVWNQDDRSAPAMNVTRFYKSPKSFDLELASGRCDVTVLWQNEIWATATTAAGKVSLPLAEGETYSIVIRTPDGKTQTQMVKP